MPEEAPTPASKPPPPPDPPERQALAVEAAGRIYDCLFEIGCGHFKQFFLAAQKMPKNIDVRWAFDNPKLYEDLVKSAEGPKLVKKFAKVMSDTANFIMKNLKEDWTRFGLLIKRKDKDLSVNLELQTGEITGAAMDGEVPMMPPTE